MKVNTFKFAGKTIVSSHVAAFWIEAHDIVCIQFSGGAIIQASYPDGEDAAQVFNSIGDILTTTHT